MLSNTEVARFREVADDETARPGTRLKAIDFLAADANVFFTRKTKTLAVEFRPHGTRPRREIIRLLRKLQRARLSPNMTTAARDRLIFIQSEEAYRNGASVVNHPQLFRLKPPETPTPEQLPVERVIDPVISEALRRWREEIRGHDGNEHRDG